MTKMNGRDDSMKKVVVVDGQGGKMGAALVTQLKSELSDCEIIAVGTNSAATASMLKAGADAAATGENPVIVCAADADIITGPIGIVGINALLGEITPKMAAAISESRATKVLLPVSKCSLLVVGVRELSLSEYVRLAVQKIAEMLI